MKFKVPNRYKNCAGVYYITSKDKKDYYIGHTSNFYKRYLIHCKELKYGKNHPGVALQVFRNNNAFEDLEFVFLYYQKTKQDAYRLEQLLIGVCEPSLNGFVRNKRNVNKYLKKSKKIGYCPEYIIIKS